MSRIVVVTLASLLTLAATPAAAQYGGSPGQQIDPPSAPTAPAAYAGKGDDQSVAAAPAAYDKEQADDRAIDQAADQSDDQAAEQANDEANDRAADQADGQADERVADEAEGPPPPEADDGDRPAERDGPGACRRSDGTTGAIVGGGAGALVGHGIDRHGERGTGTIIGAVIGALVGHAVAQGACR